jgi:hypothetical protein
MSRCSRLPDVPWFEVYGVIGSDILGPLLSSELDDPNTL